jgi:hypothetical protein
MPFIDNDFYIEMPFKVGLTPSITENIVWTIIIIVKWAFFEAISCQ